MPGGNKKGGGLKSSPVYKMKGFSGFGNSPVKQKIPKIDMTLNDNLNKAVKRITPVTRTGSRATYDAMKNLGIPRATGPISAGGTNPPPTVDLDRHYSKGMKQQLDYSAKAYGTDKIGQSKMTRRSFSKATRKIGLKALKFFGSKAFGVGSLMFGTLGTGSTLQASEKWGVKPTKPLTKSQIKDVSKGLTKAVYEGNKKRYGKSK